MIYTLCSTGLMSPLEFICTFKCTKPHSSTDLHCKKVKGEIFHVLQLSGMTWSKINKSLFLKTVELKIVQYIKKYNLTSSNVDHAFFHSVLSVIQ